MTAMNAVLAEFGGAVSHPGVALRICCRQPNGKECHGSFACLSPRSRRPLAEEYAKMLLPSREQRYSQYSRTDGLLRRSDDLLIEPLHRLLFLLSSLIGILAWKLFETLPSA